MEIPAWPKRWTGRDREFIYHSRHISSLRSLLGLDVHQVGEIRPPFDLHFFHHADSRSEVLVLLDARFEGVGIQNLQAVGEVGRTDYRS